MGAIIKDSGCSVKDGDMEFSNGLMDHCMKVNGKRMLPMVEGSSLMQMGMSTKGNG
jgi:hypothetical protein